MRTSLSCPKALCLIWAWNLPSAGVGRWEDQPRLGYQGSANGYVRGFADACLATSVRGWQCPISLLPIYTARRSQHTLDWSSTAEAVHKQRITSTLPANKLALHGPGCSVSSRQRQEAWSSEKGKKPDVLDAEYVLLHRRAYVLLMYPFA